MTISVPSLWNFSQSSFPSRVTLGSSTTPSSSGWWGGTRGWWGPARGWCGARGCGEVCSIPGGKGGLSGLIAGPPGPPWWWWCNAAAAAARTAASSGVCGPKPKPGKERGRISCNKTCDEESERNYKNIIRVKRVYNSLKKNRCFRGWFTGCGEFIREINCPRFDLIIGGLKLKQELEMPWLLFILSRGPFK